VTDRRTDGRTDTQSHKITAYAALAQRHVIKTIDKSEHDKQIWDQLKQFHKINKQSANVTLSN